VQWGTPLGGRALLFAASAALLTGLLVGVAPALRSGRQDLTHGLRSGVAATGGRRAGTRGVLTIMQAAFSVVLLVGAGLFIRSLWKVDRLELGIEADRVLAVWPTLASSVDGDVFLRDAVARLRAQPGVEHAALALGTPLQGGLGVGLWVPGRDSIP